MVKPIAPYEADLLKVKSFPDATFTIIPLINWLLEKEIILESQIHRIEQASNENIPFELSIACTTIEHLGSKFKALKAFVLQGIEPSPEILQDLEYIGVIQNKKIPPFVQTYFDYFIIPLDKMTLAFAEFFINELKNKTSRS